VFVLEQQRYALDLRAVERLLPMVAVSPLPEGPPIALGVINLEQGATFYFTLGRAGSMLPPRPQTDTNTEGTRRSYESFTQH
jgi:chemotaxis signal transduction protein